MKVFILVSLICAIPYALCQSELEFHDLTLEELLQVEISVASKSDEKLIDAPSTVTVFSSEEMERMGITHLEELLNFVPGYQATRDVAQGNGYSVAARGIGSVTSGSHLFLVNGIRMNDLYTGNGLYVNRFISIEDIKQVEIIRGPGSALYGSNAFVGVVNIILKDKANDGWIKGGSSGLREAGLNYSNMFGEVAISSFVRVFSETGDAMEVASDAFGSQGTTRDPVQGMDFNGTVKWRKLSMTLRHFERRLDEYLIFGGLDKDVNQERYQQDSIALNWSTERKSGWNMDLSLTYSKYTIDQMALLIPKGLELFPGFSLDNDFIGGPYIDSFMVAGQMDLNYKWGENHYLSTGVSWENHGYRDVTNNLNHNGITLEYQGGLVHYDDPENNFTDADAERTILGLYVQDKIKLGSKMDMTLGVRYDDYNDFGDTLNPRAAFIYAVNDHSRVKAMYGSAFRAPNFLELYDRNNPVDFGNPNLKPETIETVEVSYVMAKPFNLNLTWFHNKVEDIIVLGPAVEDASNPLLAPTFFNEGTAETDGLEIEFRTLFAKSWDFRLTWAHMFDVDGFRFSENSGSIILNRKGKHMNVNLNGYYREEIANFPLQGNLFLTNLGMSYRLSGNLHLTGDIQNLTEESYVTPSDPMPLGLPNRGRTWRLGLSWSR